MTAPTIAVTCIANDQNGNPVAGAVFTARLDSTEVYQGFVVPERVQAVANASGIAVLNLWPNALGVAGSLYRVTAVNPDTGRKFLDTTISVPNSPCNLHEILVQAPYPTLDAAAQALVATQGALVSATAQAASATAQAAAALVSETNAQVSAAAAFDQAGIATTKAADVLAAYGSVSALTSAVDTATAQATLATSAKTAAAASETAAAGSATAAGASAVAAAASAVTAQTGAGIATAQAVAALASADAAALSETNSAAAQSAALASASAASTSQTAAATSAGTATTKAAEALASAGSALISANAAGVSETAAAGSATTASAAATTTNPVQITVTAHGRTTGDVVCISSVAGMTQLNNRMFTVTVVDANTLELAGTDGTAFDTYTSGGSITHARFFALKAAADITAITPGNTLTTDHWGANGVAANFDEIAMAFATTYPNNVLDMRYGNEASAVFSLATAADRARTMLGMPAPGGVSTAGSNLMGADWFYQSALDQLCVISRGRWAHGSLAGSRLRYLNNSRANANNAVGFAASCYL